MPSSQSSSAAAPSSPAPSPSPSAPSPTPASTEPEPLPEVFAVEHPDPVVDRSDAGGSTETKRRMMAVLLAFGVTAGAGAVMGGRAR
ncbi:hypothetical protein GCM10027447_34210 [Glycomyces halotolerans]